MRRIEVELFRAEERVFDAMLDGWKAQMLARGLTTQTVRRAGQHADRSARRAAEQDVAPLVAA